MHTMSTYEERELLDAVKAIGKQVAAGVSAEDAAVKVAENRSLPAEHVRRVVEAYNVNATLSHFKAAEKADRSGEFDTISPDRVISRMYPDAVSTPVEKAAAEWEPESSAYTESCDFVAADIQPFYAGRASAQMDTGALLDGVLSAYAKEAAWVEQQRMELDRCDEDMVRTIDKLASYFTGIDSASVSELPDDIRDCVVERVPHVKMSGDVSTGSWEPAYKQACAACDEYIRQCARYSEAAKSLETVEKASEARVDRIKAGNAGGLMKMLGAGMVGASVGDMSDRGKAKETIDMHMYDPAFVGKIKGVQAQAALARMLEEDEVLRHADRSAVVSAFNEIADIAPAVIDHPMSLRSYLRSAVESGGLDPYDVHELIKTDVSLRKMLALNAGRDIHEG